MKKQKKVYQPKITVCIPTYEMGGHGVDFLEHSLKILSKQTYKNFDLVISDHSKEDAIEKLCKEFSGKLNIHFYKNKLSRGNSSANLNNAIKHASGTLIKILFQDDFLFNAHSLQEIVENFDTKIDQWLVTSSEHSTDGATFIRPFAPYYNDRIFLGNNTISSPSVLTIRNENPMKFDENLNWLMDCDYYKRCYDKFGLPKILNKVNVVNRIGKHQVSSKLEKKIKQTELNYVKRKYKQKKERLDLSRVTLVSVTSFDTAGSVRALKASAKDIKFHDVLLISHKKPKNLDKKITFKKCKASQLKIQDPKNTNDYSKFIAYHLADYIKSDFALVVHKNAHVLRPQKWSSEFLKYDYIGAPWSPNLHFTKSGKNIRVGNGGFSLRSKKLLESPSALNLKFTDDDTGYFHEDGLICVYHREKLEKAGIRYAPVPLATKFSGETLCKDSDLEPFGYHDNPIFKPGYLNLQKIFYWMKKII